MRSGYPQPEYYFVGALLTAPPLPPATHITSSASESTLFGDCNLIYVRPARPEPSPAAPMQHSSSNWSLTAISLLPY
jgi:hypothetical protein